MGICACIDMYVVLLYTYIAYIFLTFKNTFLFAIVQWAVSIIFCDCFISICKYVYPLHVDFK